jgi:hypothetical protein
LRLRGGRSGFTLIEAAVAASILLLTCVAVATTLSAGLDAESLVDRRSLLEATLAAERSRLAALPHYVQASPWRDQQPWQPEPPSLVAEVFPHARPALNSATAFFCDGSGPGAPDTFVTLVVVDGITVRREARFVVGAGAEWAPVEQESLEGWAVWETRSLPAATVEVALSARVGECEGATFLHADGLQPRVEPVAMSSRDGDAG